MGMKKFISYDLGTGGVKASLFDEQLGVLANSFIEYGTKYTGGNFHEQAPQGWWNGVQKAQESCWKKQEQIRQKS